MKGLMKNITKKQLQGSPALCMFTQQKIAVMNTISPPCPHFQHCRAKLHL